jgi:hypothetical protein
MRAEIAENKVELEQVCFHEVILPAFLPPFSAMSHVVVAKHKGLVHDDKRTEILANRVD